MPGLTGVGMIEVVQEHIQSCFFIIDGCFRRKAGATAFGGHEVTDVLVFYRYIEPQEQFIFRILGSYSPL